MKKTFTPYYAVIFTSVKTENNSGYAEMAELMEVLAKQQKGFLGMDSARNETGITVSYWESPEAIAGWKAQADHIIAQKTGRKDWYLWYNVKVCKVEREYEFQKPNRS